MTSLVHRSMMRVAVPLRFRLMDEIRSRERWTLEQIKAYQDAKLRQLIEHCWRYVPYYRSRWSRHISAPSDIRTVEDLQQLPVLTKDDLRDNLRALTSMAPFLKSQPARSGGSTGRPTIFRVTHLDQEYAWAQMYTGWSWAGWTPGQPFQIVGGESIGVGMTDNRTWRDRLMNRWITSGSNLTVERTRVLARSAHFDRIRVIYGYPNAIRELCELLRVIGARPKALRGVVCTAEVMRKEVREDIESALGVPVHDQYGLNDGGLFAVEGPDRDGLHFFFHRAVLEILDDENRVVNDPMKAGRAIATNLINFATPFVRYETGDMIHWQTLAASASGITWPRIGQVDGRTGDVIYLPSGRRIAMPGLTLVMRWIDGLRQYQFIQTGPAAVTVRLDRGPDLRMSEEDVLGYLRQKISHEIEWSILWAPPEMTQNHKILIIRNDWMRARRSRGESAAADVGISS
jgi:phenylacetate-CoA ligase